MYYVRCNTRSSGSSAKGTPKQALKYITDAHDAERDPTYSHAELAYIARLDPGWKTDLEGGRIPLVGLGKLRGCTDQATLARDFERACQPYHDRRGSTGYLSYTFTMPKELSLVAEGHPRKAREGMYAALQVALDATFAGKEYVAVTAIHARNESGEVHYHAHVLIGKFARDAARRRFYSLNSRSGGNTGRQRLAVLKQSWKSALDAELRQRLGLVITQGGPYARPALTLADGTYVPPLNRESRRMLDKHLCFRISEPTDDGVLKTRNFRWTHFDPTVYELSSSKGGGGWSKDALLEHFPELANRLKTYESRVLTLKRIGYLTADGRTTDAFTLHYRVHKGADHPELQRLRADLHKLARRGKGQGGSGPGGNGTPAGRDPRPATNPASEAQPDVDLWLALHRHQNLIKRLERLGVPPEEFRRICEAAKRAQPTAETLRRLRAEARRQVVSLEIPPSLPRTKTLVRAYCGVHRARLVSFFVLAKGALTLRPLECAALARKMRERARWDYLQAKDRKLAVVARRLRPLFWIGRILMPDEIHRLELAVQRCGQLASRQSAEMYFREQRARAYRRSREALRDELRDQARAAAPGNDPLLGQRERQLRNDLERSGAGLGRLQPDDRAVEQLREGLEVLRLHRPRSYATVSSWRGREAELLTQVLARSRSSGNAAARTAVDDTVLLAGRVGLLLSKERSGPSSRPATVVEPSASDVSRASARLAAVGVDPPFSVGGTGSIPRAKSLLVLASLRQAGLLDDGPLWALRAATSASFTARLRNQLAASLNHPQELDR